MSGWIRVPRSFISDRTIDPRTRVWLVLAARFDWATGDPESCRYSIATIAQMAGVSPRAANNAIDHLVAKGYVKRLQGGGRKICTRYLLTTETMHHGAQNPETVHAQVGNCAPSRQETMHHGAHEFRSSREEIPEERENSSLSPILKSAEEPKAKPPPEDFDPFLDWWSAENVARGRKALTRSERGAFGSGLARIASEGEIPLDIRARAEAWRRQRWAIDHDFPWPTFLKPEQRARAFEKPIPAQSPFERARQEAMNQNPELWDKEVVSNFFGERIRHIDPVAVEDAKAAAEAARGSVTIVAPGATKARQPAARLVARSPEDLEPEKRETKRLREAKFREEAKAEAAKKARKEASLWETPGNAI